jgi:hypothetical protein
MTHLIKLLSEYDKIKDWKERLDFGSEIVRLYKRQLKAYLKKNPEKYTSLWLFRGGYPTSTSYSDKLTSHDADYKKIAFVQHDGELSIYNKEKHGRWETYHNTGLALAKKEVEKIAFLKSKLKIYHTYPLKGKYYFTYKGFLYVEFERLETNKSITQQIDLDDVLTPETISNEPKFSVKLAAEYGLTISVFSESDFIKKQPMKPQEVTTSNEKSIPSKNKEMSNQKKLVLADDVKTFFQNSQSKEGAAVQSSSGKTYDTPKKLNRGKKQIDPELAKKIEKEGITIEELERLQDKGFPVFKYKTQVTVHGDFSEVAGFGRVGGYKTLLFNKNNTLGIKYNGIDNKKKREVGDLLWTYNYVKKFADDSENKQVYWILNKDSKGTELRFSSALQKAEDLVDALPIIKEQYENFPIDNIYGDIGIFKFKFWGTTYITIGVSLNAFYEGDKYVLYRYFTNGLVTDKASYDKLYAAFAELKRKEKEQSDADKIVRQEAEQKEKEKVELKMAATAAVLTESGYKPVDSRKIRSLDIKPPYIIVRHEGRIDSDGVYDDGLKTWSVAYNKGSFGKPLPVGYRSTNITADEIPTKIKSKREAEYENFVKYQRDQWTCNTYLSEVCQFYVLELSANVELERTADTSPIVGSDCSVMETNNFKKAGIEIRFTSSPDASVLKILNASAFQWSRRKALWWAYYTDALWAFANEVCSGNEGDTDLVDEAEDDKTDEGFHLKYYDGLDVYPNDSVIVYDSYLDEITGISKIYRFGKDFNDKIGVDSETSHEKKGAGHWVKSPDFHDTAGGFYLGLHFYQGDGISLYRLDKELAKKEGLILSINKQRELSIKETSTTDAKKDNVTYVKDAVYSYYLLSRPMGYGTQPPEGFISGEKDGKHKFERIDYSRKLTLKELKHYNLGVAANPNDFVGGNFVYEWNGGFYTVKIIEVQPSYITIQEAGSKAEGLSWSVFYQKIEDDKIINISFPILVVLPSQKSVPPITEGDVLKFSAGSIVQDNDFFAIKKDGLVRFIGTVVSVTNKEIETLTTHRAKGLKLIPAHVRERMSHDNFRMFDTSKIDTTEIDRNLNYKYKGSNVIEEHEYQEELEAIDTKPLAMSLSNYLIFRYDKKHADKYLNAVKKMSWGDQYPAAKDGSGTYLEDKNTTNRYAYEHKTAIRTALERGRGSEISYQALAAYEDLIQSYPNESVKALDMISGGADFELEDSGEVIIDLVDKKAGILNPFEGKEDIQIFVFEEAIQKRRLEKVEAAIMVDGLAIKSASGSIIYQMNEYDLFIKKKIHNRLHDVFQSYTKEGYEEYLKGLMNENPDNIVWLSKDYLYLLDKDKSKQDKIVPANLSPKHQIIQTLHNHWANGDKINKTHIRKIALANGIDDLKMAYEITEVAWTIYYRHLIEMDANKSNELDHVREQLIIKKSSSRKKYDSVVDFYENQQPTYSVRDAITKIAQQFSTAAPIAFLAGYFCEVDEKKVKTILEPSGGNGLLTILAPYEKILINEIDEIRLANLKIQNFKEVTALDASDPKSFENKARQMDVVLMNPPFNDLESSKYKYDGIQIGRLDAYMIAIALETLKNDGRAAFIMGGHTTFNEKDKIAKHRPFFNWLFRNYCVADIINIDSKKLYHRQGTSFPLQMILIQGRKEVPHGSAPYKNLDNAEWEAVVSDTDTLWNRVERAMQRSIHQQDDLTMRLRRMAEMAKDAFEFMQYEVSSYKLSEKRDYELFLGSAPKFHILNSGTYKEKQIEKAKENPEYSVKSRSLSVLKEVFLVFVNKYALKKPNFLPNTGIIFHNSEFFATLALDGTLRDVDTKRIIE